MSRDENPIPEGYYEARHAQGEIGECDWTEPGLKVTRLRLIGDPGYPMLDVSYCHGILDGKHVDVVLPFSELPRRGFRKVIVALARKDNVYAEGIGILSNISVFV